ncbi:MAG: sulfatase-like hydrolase/transferase [Polyangiales bacterium]
MSPPESASGVSPSRLPAVADAVLYAAALATLAISLQYSDDAVCAFINVGLFALPLLLTLTLGGRPKVALAVASAVGLLIWGVGEIKMHFFRERLGLLDFHFLGTGANWSIVKRYPRMQLALLAWVGVVLGLALAAYHRERGRPRLGGRTRAMAALALIGWCAGAHQFRQHHLWEVFREDADCGEERVCGVMARLVYSYGAFEFLPPLPVHDPAAFQRAALALPSARREGTSAVHGPRPDIVVWLHESTLDPAQYRLDGLTLPRFPMFAQTEHTRASGLLRVHTFGGRTWLSEFSLLTGLVPDDFGMRRNLVFNSVAPSVSSTFVHRLEAAGYETVVLMPTSRAFYGASRTYEAVGFDRVLTLRDFPEYDAIPGDEWEISDSPRMAEAAANYLRRHHARPDAKPLFIYFLSIREHTPYFEKTEPAYGLERAGIDRALAGQLTDYVERLRALNQGTEVLERALTTSPRPALWAYFGDHQANFENAPLTYRHDLPDPEMITQYQIRANYLPRVDERPALLDIAMLPSLLGDLAGVPGDAYAEAQSAMRRLCDGRLRDCPHEALVASYKGFVFDPALGLFGPRPSRPVEAHARP